MFIWSLFPTLLFGFHMSYPNLFSFLFWRISKPKLIKSRTWKPHLQTTTFWFSMLSSSRQQSAIMRPVIWSFINMYKVSFHFVLSTELYDFFLIIWFLLNVSDKPGMLDFKGKAKWESWNGKKGMYKVYFVKIH